MRIQFLPMPLIDCQKLYWLQRRGLFDSQDIGWPVKGIPGKYAEHFICLKNEDKIKWMESRLA